MYVHVCVCMRTHTLCTGKWQHANWNIKNTYFLGWFWETNLNDFLLATDNNTKWTNSTTTTTTLQQQKNYLSTTTNQQLQLQIDVQSQLPLTVKHPLTYCLKLWAGELNNPESTWTVQWGYHLSYLNTWALTFFHKKILSG